MSDDNPSAAGGSEEASKLSRLWRSPDVERILSRYDIESTAAHVRMLGETGIVHDSVAHSVLEALDRIKGELGQGKSFLRPEHPDVHTALEARLGELVGEAAATVRVAVSTNDQLATDIRLWLRDVVVELFGSLIDLRSTLIDLADRDMQVLMPGYTHMQPAMPILLSHWWLAIEARFRADFTRLSDLYRRLNALPLGAGALSGIAQPIDRQLVARYLGFDEVIENSLIAVFDRDYLIEFASFASVAGLHLSQVGADLLMWSTQEFGFVSLRKAFVFPSRTMPQKRNPVVLEVLRSRPSIILGRLVEFVSTLKAVPMGFSEELQVCLPSLLSVADNLAAALELARTVLPAIEVNAERMKEAASADLTNAAAAVDYLVARGLPAEKAAKVVDDLVSYCRQRKKYLADLELNEWQQFSPAFAEDIHEHVTVEGSVGARSSYGGTSLEQVMMALERAREVLRYDREHLPKLARQRLVEGKQGREGEGSPAVSACMEAEG